MFGGPYRPRVVPVSAGVDSRLDEKAVNSVAGSFRVCAALQCPTNSIWNRIGGAAPSPEEGAHGTNSRPAGGQVPVSSFLPATSSLSAAADFRALCRQSSPLSGRASAGTHRRSLGHRYHDDEVPSSSSVVKQQHWGSASTSRDPSASLPVSGCYQQLAAQHLYGTASSSTAGAATPSPSTPATRGSGGAAATPPSSMLRFTNPRSCLIPSAHGNDSQPHEARQGSRSPAPGNPIVSASRDNGDAVEGCSEMNALSAESTPAVVAGAAVPSSAAQGCDNAQSMSVMRRPASARNASELSPTQSHSSVTAPSSSRTVAVTKDGQLRSCGSVAWCERQQQRQRHRSRSLPFHFTAPATFVSAKRPPPLRRTAQWAVKLIEDFVAQIALQQESVAAAPTTTSSNGTANALGRKATAGVRDAASTTTVADLTATFLASRYGALQWRPILHEFAACLHRYRRVSPACAVFREYFIHVGTENLGDFYTFCNLYAAGDIQHCSTVETRRVALAATTAAKAQTIVSRRYVDKREVRDRLQHMLRRVSLSDYTPRLLDGAAGGALGCDTSGGGSTSRQPSRCVQYRYARHPPACTALMPQRRHLTVEEIRWVKKAILGWMEEAALKCIHERSPGAGVPYEDDDKKNDVRCGVSEAELQRVAFDREGRVDAYALLQATLEAVKLVCRVDHSPPERCHEEAGQVDDAPDGYTQAYTHPAEAVPQSQRSHDHSYVQSLTQSAGGESRAAEARHVTQRSREPACVSSDSRSWSPSRDSFVTPCRNSGGRSSSRLSPWRQVAAAAAAAEHRLCSSARPVEQLRPGSRESEAEGCRGCASDEEPSFAPHERPHHDYGCQAQMQGDKLWLEAQREAAAASLRRDRCWRDHYPRTYARLQLKQSTRNPSNSARAAWDNFACSSPPANATVGAIDAELRLHQARSRDASLSLAGETTANPAHLSQHAFAAAGALFLENPKGTPRAAHPTECAPLPSLFSRSAPSFSAAAYPSRIHPALARSPRSTASPIRKSCVERSKPASSSLDILSQRTASFPHATNVNVAYAGPHVSHTTASAEASNTVLLTKEEQAMLDQLEIALRRLDTHYQRNRVTTTSAAADVPTAATKTYA